MSAAVEGKLISPLIVWNNTLVDGHNRYEIVQEHPEISFSTMPLPFESREEVLAWICKNQLGRRNLTPEQKKFLIGKQYSVEHRKPGGNGNNQHTTAAKKTAPEESSIRKQIAERNRLIMQTTKNRKFPPVGNSLLYISLLSVALIASFTSSAILNNLFAICNSRLLPTNQIVNCDGRVRPQGRTLFLFCI